jgi:AraC-like DNA-binding protein
VVQATDALRVSTHKYRPGACLQEVPVRTLNSRVSFARRNGENAVTPDEGVTHATAIPPRPLTSIMPEVRVRRILRMVESGTTLTIRDLALEFNLSPSYLQRLFKHQTGVCMGEWLNEQRLQRAAHLLANSYMSVKEIAHTIGYEHASSFIRAFERRFTQAPARYRKQTDCTKC